MKIVRVIGTATATLKEAGLSGQKFMVVQPVAPDGAPTAETACVAVDAVGAGRGDLCLMVSGSAARIVRGAAGLPVDAALIAVVDRISL
ncbi:MAG: EutN/CcmL family microcompartment protein [Pararhodobacter sp.]|nr:EutN/CcmL family microcompartment protein [Pararhodobacter sp.]